MAGGKMILFKKQTTRGNKTAINTAKRALKMAKGNRTVEALNYNIVGQVLSSTPSIRFIQPPSTEGGKQTIQHIEGKIWVRQDITSAIIDNYRIDLVLDRQPNGAILNLDNIYNSTTPRITVLKDFELKDRYKILKTWIGAFSLGETTRMIKIFERSGLKSESDSNSFFDQIRISKNAYYLVAWTEATANQPLLTYDLRIVSVTA